MLHDDIICYIFQFLDQYEKSYALKVSKHWNELTRRPASWYAYIMSGKFCNIKFDVKMMSTIKRLESYSREISEEVLATLTQLEYLYLENPIMTTNTFDKLTNLLTLSLHGNYIRYPVTNRMIKI